MSKKLILLKPLNEFVNRALSTDELFYFDEKRKYSYESYRADALTWTNGLKEFVISEIITWELKTKQYFFQQSTTNFRIQFALLKLIK
jgi:hypothetical protein